MPRQAKQYDLRGHGLPGFPVPDGDVDSAGRRARIAEGNSRGKIWLYIVGRALVAIGLFIANGPQVDQQHAGI
jgi:hypothetical protein